MRHDRPGGALCVELNAAGFRTLRAGDEMVPREIEHAIVMSCTTGNAIDQNGA